MVRCFFVFVFVLGEDFWFDFRSFSRGGNLDYIAWSDYSSFDCMETGSGLDLYWVTRTNLKGWGACSDEPQCWLTGDLACAIWPEDGISPLGVFYLTSRLKGVAITCMLYTLFGQLSAG